MGQELMKAVVITGPKLASLQQIERWSPEPNEILVRCKAAAICTTERRVFSGALPYYPAIGGHEFTGAIERIGESGSDLKPGDHVAVDAHNRCGHCHYCIKGHDNLCVNVFKPRKDYKYVMIGGGFAEFAALLPSQVVKLPQSVSLEEASLTEPLACCVHSIKKAQLSFGDTIAIVGAGTMGALHLLLAKMLGAKTIVSDIDEARLKLIKDLGANVVMNPEVNDGVEVVKEHTNGRGADVVVVAASARRAGKQGLAMVGRSGRVIYYASLHPPGMLELDWNRIHYGEIMVTGTEGSTKRDFHEAVSLLGSGAINVRPLISKIISLEELPAELETNPAGETQRVVVKL